MIDVKNLSAGYTHAPVIRNINFEVERGTTVCVIGPNGCGKSTLLKCMAKQLRPLSGHIMLHKEPITAIPGKAYAQKVAYLKQSRDLPAISVENLILHGRFPYLGFPRRLAEHDREMAKAAMLKTGVWAHRGKMLSELSGGECQKVYLAMALAQDTDILLLDEPTTFLDISSQLELLDLICQLKVEGKTVITVLHDIAGAIKIADAVCLMSEGNMIFCGAPAELLRLKLIDEVFNISVSSTVVDGACRLFFERCPSWNSPAARPKISALS